MNGPASEKSLTEDHQAVETKAALTQAKSGLSLKDKVTLILSTTALAISVATFIIGRLDARASQARQAAEIVATQIGRNYKAYSLGQQVVNVFIYWFEVPKGNNTAQQLAQAKEIAAFELSKLQQLSDLNDLRISDVRRLFTSPSAVGLDPSQPFREIRARMYITHDTQSIAAYELGYASLLMYVRSVAFTERPGAAQGIVDSYPQVAESINRNCRELGINRTIPARLASVSEIQKEMKDLKQYLEDLWSH